MFSTTLLLVFFAGGYLASGVPTPSDGIDGIKSSSEFVSGLVTGKSFSFPVTHDHVFRSKRQTGWGDRDDQDAEDNQDTDSLLCILACVNQLKRASEPFKNDDRVQNGAGKLMRPDLNLTRFNEVCAAMRPPVQCFDRCPTSTLKTSLKPTLEPIRYICIDRFQDFLDNARCFRKLDRLAETRCKPGCRRFESAVNKTIELGERPYLRSTYSIDELREMLSGTCQYIECYQACSVPLVRTACGDTAAELVTGVTQKMFVAAQSLSSIGGGGQLLPEACQRLARPQRLEIESRRNQARRFFGRREEEGNTFGTDSDDDQD